MCFSKEISSIIIQKKKNLSYESAFDIIWFFLVESNMQPVFGSDGGWWELLLLRVAKCHRYGRYICVKILEGWGKNWWRPRSFVKWSSCWVNSTNFDVGLSLNQLLFPFKYPSILNFIQFKCKFSLKDLLCVKDMTFCDSAPARMHLLTSLSCTPPASSSLTALKVYCNQMMSPNWVWYKMKNSATGKTDRGCFSIAWLTMFKIHDCI